MIDFVIFIDQVNTCHICNRKLVTKFYSQNTEFYLRFLSSIDDKNSNGANLMILSPAVAEIDAFQYVFRSRSTFYLTATAFSDRYERKMMNFGGGECC